LKLDHNIMIGNAGIEVLAESLRKNKTLQMLSLAYCGMTGPAAEALFPMLIYQGSVCE